MTQIILLWLHFLRCILADALEAGNKAVLNVLLLFFFKALFHTHRVLSSAFVWVSNTILITLWSTTLDRRVYQTVLLCVKVFRQVQTLAQVFLKALTPKTKRPADGTYCFPRMSLPSVNMFPCQLDCRHTAQSPWQHVRGQLWTLQTPLIWWESGRLIISWAVE